MTIISENINCVPSINFAVKLCVKQVQWKETGQNQNEETKTTAIKHYINRMLM